MSTEDAVLEDKFLDELYDTLTIKQAEGDILSVGRIYEVVGHIKIGLLSAATSLNYWKPTNTGNFFIGIRYLIKSARCYAATNNNDAVNSIIDRTIQFLNYAITQRVFDDEVIYGLSHELIGDLLCLRSNKLAESHYSKALEIYEQYIGDEPSEIEAWQAQEEFEAIGAISERLNEEVVSDVVHIPYEQRLERKKNCDFKFEESE